MKVEKFLLQFKELEQIIRIKVSEKERWELIAEGGNAHSEGEKVQSSTDPQKMAEAVAMCVDIQKEIEDCLIKAVQAMKDITSVIEQLPTDEYVVLHKMYIGRVEKNEKEETYTVYMTIKEVAAEKKKSYSWASHVHSRAKKHVQEILDSKEA